MKFLVYSPEKKEKKSFIELRKRERPENIKIFKMISRIKV